MTVQRLEVTNPEWNVPPADLVILRPGRSRWCVAVFAVNEGQRLHRELERMRPHANAVDIVVIDGGSTDGSVAPPRLLDLGVHTLLCKRDGPGLGGQMRIAFAYALERGYDGIITIDGNNKDDPAAIPAFVTALEQGADHIQGSRFIPGGRHEHTPLSRLLGVRLLHAPLISLAAGFRYTDTTNGFRAYSARFLTDPRVAPFRPAFTGYELHYYLAIRAAELGFNVLELPVTRCYPSSGKVPTKISPVRGNLKVLHALWASVRRRYHPPVTEAPCPEP